MKCLAGLVPDNQCGAGHPGPEEVVPKFVVRPPPVDSISVGKDRDPGKPGLPDSQAAAKQIKAIDHWVV